jgi:hypothetical protein
MPTETHHQADPIHAPARQAQNQAHRTGPTIDLAMTWAGALPMLLAVLRHGVPEGQRQAEAELLRMARAADLAAELKAAASAEARQAPVDPRKTPEEEAELATILAALRFYQEHGQGDPDNRSAGIHAIATADGDVISLDAEGIDDLCMKLNGYHL